GGPCPTSGGMYRVAADRARRTSPVPRPGGARTHYRVCAGNAGNARRMRMNAEELRALQAPIKARYKDDPSAGRVTLRARGTLGAEAITCKVETGRALVEAGLHPATGGDGLAACSGDMLLEALVACAGVTLRAVATALGIALRGGSASAEGDLDFRGTL